MQEIFFFSDKFQSRFFCPNNCGRSYKRKNARTLHVKYECGVEPKFQCYVCLKKFARKDSLKNHLVTVHKIIPFQ